MKFSQPKKIRNADFIPLKIVNLISTCYFNSKFDLKNVSEKLQGKYNTRTFSGCILKQKIPKTTILLFSNGKANCLGAKTEKDSIQGFLNLSSELSNIGYSQIKMTNFQVANIVVTGGVGFYIDLRRFYTENIKNCIWYQELFSPGLTYYINGKNLNPKRKAVMIFYTGKFNISGFTSFCEIEKYFNKSLFPLLRKYSNNIEE